jgi:hypothetical protein
MVRGISDLKMILSDKSLVYLLLKDSLKMEIRNSIIEEIGMKFKRAVLQFKEFFYLNIYEDNCIEKNLLDFDAFSTRYTFFRMIHMISF